MKISKRITKRLSILTNKRWTTEITSMDVMYLEKLGVKLTV